MDRAGTESSAEKFEERWKATVQCLETSLPGKLERGRDWVGTIQRKGRGT